MPSSRRLPPTPSPAASNRRGRRRPAARRSRGWRTGTPRSPATAVRNFGALRFEAGRSGARRSSLLQVAARAVAVGERRLRLPGADARVFLAGELGDRLHDLVRHGTQQMADGFPAMVPGEVQRLAEPHTGTDPRVGPQRAGGWNWCVLIIAHAASGDRRLLARITGPPPGHVPHALRPWPEHDFSAVPR